VYLVMVGIHISIWPMGCQGYVYRSSNVSSLFFTVFDSLSFASFFEIFSSTLAKLIHFIYNVFEFWKFLCDLEMFRFR